MIGQNLKKQYKVIFLWQDHSPIHIEDSKQWQSNNLGKDLYSVDASQAEHFMLLQQTVDEMWS